MEWKPSLTMAGSAPCFTRREMENDMGKQITDRESQAALRLTDEGVPGTRELEGTRNRTRETHPVRSALRRSRAFSNRELHRVRGLILEFGE
jgi:hypothetical protein